MDVLLHRDLLLHMLHNSKYNIQENIFESVKTFWFIITTTNIKQMHEVEYNTFNRAQSHS